MSNKCNLSGLTEPENKVRCGNCGWTGTAKETRDIADLDQRLDPGGIVPVGECPECCAFAYLSGAATLARHLDQAHILLERLHTWGRSMGGWDSPVWRDLDAFLEGAAQTPQSPVSAPTAPEVQSPVQPDAGVPVAKSDREIAFLDDMRARWGRAIAKDTEINGGDLVEWLGEHWPYREGPAPFAPAKRLRLQCRACGATNIHSDASAAWDEERQLWIVVNTYDKDRWCIDCDAENDVEEIEIEA